jgi:hypothetical protein
MERIFGRCGVDLDRNTLGDWVAALADVVTPVSDEMKRQLLWNHLLQSDDTPVTVLAGKKPSWTGRLWVYGPPEGEVVFEFTEDRSGAGPLRFLKGFTGVLQADAYSGYDVVFRTLAVLEAGAGRMPGGRSPEDGSARVGPAGGHRRALRGGSKSERVSPAERLAMRRRVAYRERIDALVRPLRSSCCRNRRSRR